MEKHAADARSGSGGPDPGVQIKTGFGSGRSKQPEYNHHFFPRMGSGSGTDPDTNHGNLMKYKCIY